MNATSKLVGALTLVMAGIIGITTIANNSSHARSTDYSELALKFRPIVLTNRKDCYLPVAISEVYTSIVLEKYLVENGWDGNSKTISFDEFAEQSAKGKTDGYKAWDTNFNWENDRSILLPDLFWRAGVLDSEQNKVFIQYFWFCTYSDVDAPQALVDGDHDGDWLAVELWLRLSSKQPQVEQVIFHNHGRQIVATKEQCHWDESRLIIYAEHNSNEPWPVPGDNGEEIGAEFKTNKRFMTAKLGDLGNFPRARSGNGTRISIWLLRAVGEKNKPNTQDGTPQVKIFHGGHWWGKRPGDINKLPKSPAHQPKMWDRKFKMP